MVWLAFSLMTAAALLSVAWPLVRPRREMAADAGDVGFYRDQIRELDADLARGLLRPADVEATRAELGRRLIAAADRAGRAIPAIRPHWAAASLSVLVIVAVGTGLYAEVGHPGLPDEPLASRETGPDDLVAAVARLEAHLAAAPDDGRGFELIAPVYMRMRRFEDAARAYREAIRVLGSTPARLSALGQALVMGADGVVTGEARRTFDAALKGDPTEPEALFFIGLAALQDGDKAKARAIWTALVAQAPPGAPYAEVIRNRIAALDGAEPPVPPTVAGTPMTGTPMTGMPAGAAAVAALPADQQQVAIRGMVDGLAARLARDGNDPDGWLRLVRAYRVLGETDLARKALADARKSSGGDPQVLGRLDRLAHDLGLEG